MQLFFLEEQPINKNNNAFILGCFCWRMYRNAVAELFASVPECLIDYYLNLLSIHMKEFQHPFLFTFFIFFKQKTKNLPHLPEKVPKMVGI